MSESTAECRHESPGASGRELQPPTRSGWHRLAQDWARQSAGRESPPTLFLDEAALHQVLAGALRVDTLRPQLDRWARLHVLLPLQALAALSCTPRQLADALATALSAASAGVDLVLLVLAHGVGERRAQEAELPEALAALSQELLHWMRGARRRVPDYFARKPLVLPFSGGQGPGLHLLEPAALLDFLAEGAGRLPPGCHLLQAPAWRGASLFLRELALALDIPVADACQGRDGISELLEDSLSQACQRWELGHESPIDSRSFDSTVSCVPEAGAWEAAWQAYLETQRQAHPAGTQPAPRRWAELPGLRLQAIEGSTLRAWRLGEGAHTVLLLNAFGLSLDVWYELALALSPHCTVLALEARDDTALAAQALSSTYYDSEDSWPRFLQGVRQLRDTGGAGPLHLLSWCGGAKFALELARALPHEVASVCLLAPSYAGVDCGQGGDSAFEASLHTMCRVVQRTPAAAETMARSMLALLQRGDGAADDPQRLWSLPDANTVHWLHEPYVSAERMRQYSRQLCHFRAHAMSLPPDVAPLEQPCLVLMGDSDAATCAERARAMTVLCARSLTLGLRAAGHYLVHQEAALIAGLQLAFMREGLQLSLPDTRLRRFAPTEEDLVSGEL